MRRRRPDAAESFDQLQPDPSQVGGVAEAPFVRLPDPARLFAGRVRRLGELAPGHMLADYLELLGRVASAQAEIAAILPPPAAIPADVIAQRAEHGFPPIAVDQVRGSADLAHAIGLLLAAVDIGPAPEQAHQSLEAVRAMPGEERLALATDIFQGGPPVDRIGESLFVAAALQVYLTALATRLDAGTVQPSAEGVCPACGGAPVASVVVGWTQASKARYCACSLCGTLWNHVRIKCTACGSTEGIAYFGIEEAPGPVGAETCSTCNSYVKHMQQHEAVSIDPVADDVASYALDLLVQQEGFRRASFNPLFLTG